MLRELHIENVAVIERADLELGAGLNILTGETGAGKSILVDAMHAILGARASRELVRTGAEKAVVCATFDPDPCQAWCEENEIECDDELIIRRQITAEGKTSCRVCGVPVTTAQLRTLGALLLDIHGQNDGQHLLDEREHLRNLDRFGQLEPELARYREQFRAYQALCRERDTLSTYENEKELLEHCIVQMETETGLDRNAALADMRYSFIENVVSTSVVKCHESREHARSMKFDRILTGRYTAIPTFLAVMLLTFYLTFNVIGQRLSDWMDVGIDALTALADRALTAYGINPVVHSLIIDGIFAGVGSVLVFLPIIVTLFFFLSILEDTGYMARVAFVMDKPLRKIGLSGRSIVPMLIGFGCSVPAIMATRTVSSDRDRKMTILLTPYMSCSAKISIYAFFTAAFCPKYQALVMISLYLLGIMIGIVAALIMNQTAFRGKPVPFVMELPNYRLPSLKSVALLLWEKARDFLERAFTVIFLATIIIWFLQSFDTRLNVVTDSADSLLALIGRWIAPAFAPLGFADWRCATSLISGFIAKESVVSTLKVLLGGAALTTLFASRSAISFLVFTLLYTPCIAAVATIRREFGSTLKTVGVVLMQCCVAWITAFIVYTLAGIL